MEYLNFYGLSVAVFEAGRASGFDRYFRLGEFLTEWNNGLGRSHVEVRRRWLLVQRGWRVKQAF